MKKLISYRGNRTVVSTVEEAIEFIETIYEPVISETLKVTDVCKRQLESAFSDESGAVRKVYPLNGGNRGVLVSNSLGETLLEHIKAMSEISGEPVVKPKRTKEVNIHDSLNIFEIEEKMKRRARANELNERKSGIYKVELTLIYATNGKTKRYKFCVEVNALSALNAYNKATDMAAAYCEENNWEFVMVKELYTKYTNIEWLRDE